MVETADDRAATLRRTARRYRGGDRFSMFYVAFKLRMDPVHAAILAVAARTPFGTVLDLGSGRGQMGVALLEAGSATAVLALDHDARALAALRYAGSGLALRTQPADLAESGPDEAADTVLLIDVLYQFPTTAQLGLLQRAAAQARHRVVIRATDPARGWRSGLSSLLERLGRGIWPTFGERWNPLPPARLAQVLVGCGFAVRMEPCDRRAPLGGVLVIGTRPVGAVWPTPTESR